MFGVAQHKISHGTAAVAADGLRLEPEHLAVIGDRPLQIVRYFARTAAVPIAICIAWIDPDRCVEIGDRTIIVTLIVVAQPAPVVGDGKLGSSRIASLRSAIERS